MPTKKDLDNVLKAVLIAMVPTVIVSAINLHSRTAVMESKWALHEPVTTKGLADIGENAKNLAVVQSSLAAMTNYQSTMADTLIEIGKEITAIRIELASRHAESGSFDWESPECVLP